MFKLSRFFIFKKAPVWVALAMAVVLFAPDIQADPSPVEDFLIRVEVEENKGEENQESVSISAPLTLLENVFEALPDELREELEDSGINSRTILNELTSQEKLDLIQVKEDNESVRIWVEPVGKKNREALNFLKIDVLNSKEEVHLSIPAGIAKLGAKMAAVLDISDELLKDCPYIKIEHKNRENKESTDTCTEKEQS